MKKLWSIVLTLMLLMGMMPSYAFAGSIDDVNVVRTGKAVTLPKGDVKVTVTSDGTLVEDQQLVDPSKPAEMKVEFSMELNDTVKPGDYMEIDLPSGMDFSKEQSLDLRTEAGEIVGVLSVSGRTGKVVFSELIASEDYLGIESSFTASIAFHVEEISVDNPNLKFSVFGNDFTINIDPDALAKDEAKIALIKDGKTDFKNNIIEWTITASPEKNGQPDGEALYDGYVFEDVLPANVEYVTGSFALNGVAISEGEAGTGVVYDSEKGTLQYAFQEGVTGVQTVRYKTGVTLEAGKTLTAKNSASLEKDDQIITAEKSVDFTPILIKKSGNYNLKEHSINWSIMVNGSGANLKNVVITDQLAKGLSLADNGVVVDKPLGTDPSAAQYYSIDENNKLIIHLGDLTGLKIVRITTALDGTIRGSVTNKASINWDDQGSNVIGGAAGASDIVNVEASVPVNKGFIEKKAGSYDFTKNEMTWDITVNQANQSLKDAKVVEVFAYSTNELYGTGSVPASIELGDYPRDKANLSQRFAEGSVLLNGSPIDSAMVQVEQLGKVDSTVVQKVTISLGDISGVQELQMKTKVTNFNGYGINGSYNIANKVLLYDADSSTPTSAEAFTKWDSSVLEKRVEKEYDYSDHTITWAMVVNRNKIVIPAGGAVTDTLPADWSAAVTDTLPADWSAAVTDGGALDYQIYRGDSSQGQLLNGEELSKVLKTATVDGGNLKFELNQISDTYTIVLKTKLSDEGVRKLAAKTEKTEVVNQAKLTGKNIPANNGNAQGTALIRSNSIYKTGEMETDESGAYTGNVLWTVEVLRNVITAGNDSDKTYVVDHLEKYLEPVTNGGRYDVRMTELNWDGSQGEAVSDEVVQANISYDQQKRELRMQLPNPDGNYRILVNTRLTDDEVVKLSNRATLEGYNINTTTQAKDIRIENLGGEAWAKLAGKITLSKEDAKTGEPLSGAVFELYEADQNGEYTLLKYTKTTGENGQTAGQLVFGRLPSGTYKVVETQAPAGYKLDSKPQLITINTEAPDTQNLTLKVKNEVLTGAVQVKKVDSRGDGLAGAEFTLFNSVGTKMQSVTSAGNGTVAFGELPAGSYSIRETKAPTGYIMSDEEITAKVSADGTVEYATDGNNFSDRIVAVTNQPNTVKLAVLKVDQDTRETKLAGAVFELRDSSGNLLQSGKTDEQGMIIWNVTSGNYVVKEITPPTGYQLNLASAAITPEDFPKDGGGIVITVGDRKEDSGGNPDNPGENPDNPGENPDNPGTNPDNPGGGTGGGGSSSGGGGNSGGRYDPPTVDIVDPDVPLSEGIPGVTDNPAVMPEETPLLEPAQQDPLYGIEDGANPLGDKEMNDPAKKLPKTGGIGTGLFWGLGMLILALGAGLRKKENKIK